MIHSTIRSRFLFISFFLIAFSFSYHSLSLGVSASPVFTHKTDKDPKEVQCESCQAVISILSSLIPPPVAVAPSSTASAAKKKKSSIGSRELLISSAFDSLCTTKNLGKFKYSPPTMLKSCESFIGEFSEELELIYYQGKLNEYEIRQHLCNKKCNNILWENTVKKEL